MNDTILNILPISALIAVVLFISRELLECYRRRRGRKRKIEAIGRLLSRELELNHWVIKSTKETLKSFENAINEEFKIVVTKRADGETTYEIFGENEYWHTSKIWNSLSDHLTEHLIELAQIDPERYELADETLQSISETQHVIDDLIDYMETDDDTKLARRLGFIDYARDVLQNTYCAMNNLYKSYNNQELTEHRLR